MQTSIAFLQTEKCVYFSRPVGLGLMEDFHTRSTQTICFSFWKKKCF